MAKVEVNTILSLSMTVSCNEKLSVIVSVVFCCCWTPLNDHLQRRLYSLETSVRLALVGDRLSMIKHVGCFILALNAHF